MTGTYYIMPDQESGAAWTFGPEQLSRTVAGHWPGSRVSGPAGEVDVHDLTVRVAGEEVALDYWPAEQFFAFRDQDPLELPFRIAYTILLELAAGSRVIWVADFDATPHPVELSQGLAHALSRSPG
ncbi:hypothetical protein [Kitasatospora sp. GAS204B]|uniref:hypothetical protein n=1 Tax=unclassified Kitasatospora TaxID=2633591 RepID=UPI0024759794|nr:hypothetical protein [Kitasatospora sp. GAS204B]MDH6118499.1 hypothetical protein [Kitasatospora sp. GAS204B]